MQEFAAAPVLHHCDHSHILAVKLQPGEYEWAQCLGDLAQRFAAVSFICRGSHAISAAILMSGASLRIVEISRCQEALLASGKGAGHQKMTLVRLGLLPQHL